MMLKQMKAILKNAAVFFIVTAILAACPMSAGADLCPAEGEAFATLTSSTNAVVPIYAFYSAYMSDFFYTASYNEKVQLEYNYANGIETYKYIGVVGYGNAYSDSWNVPVYRFWNEKTTDHFYTISESEKKQVQEDYETGHDNYRYEGIAWYAPTWSSIPVYRFFDIYDFNHYYTSDEAEKNRMADAYLNGNGSWRFEGIAWYSY